MFVIVAGGGRTGTQLASLLLAQDHIVHLVEHRPEILARIYPVGLTPFGDLDALAVRVNELLIAAPPVPPEPVFPLRQMLDETLALYESLPQVPRSLA